MATERTIRLNIDGTKAITELRRVRGEIDASYAELRKTTPIELDGSKAKTVLKNLDSDINSTAKSTKEIGKNAEGSVGGFKKLTISTKAFGAALKAAGIGLVLSAVVKLGAALGKNQVVMDALNVVTETISITFQELVNKVVKTTQVAVKFFNKVGGAIQKFVKKDLDGLTSSYEANNEVVETTIQKNRRLAKEIVLLRNEVKLADAQQRGLQLTYQKDAELQRQLRDDVSLTFEERIAANEKLGRILDEQFSKEQELANKKLLLAEKELAKNKDNIDLQVNLQNAKNEMLDLDERITGQRSEQLINLKALEKERYDVLQAGIEKTITLTKKGTEENKSASANAITLMNQQLAAHKNTSQADVVITKLTQAQKIDIISGALGQISGALGENSKAGKAMAIAQALMDTYAGANKALAQGGIFGAISAAGIVAAGLANVARIKSTNPETGGDDGPSPDTNVPQPTGLGGSGLIPNLENINQNDLGTPEPVQAFVVENDISNAQALQEELEIQATL
tara:strand:- start:1067 stop:2605 length:1539 start_codon:yes stop_codon:yes gene_type:complete